MIRLDLSSPISDISRIGSTVASQLKHLGVLTLKDLLFYFPSRYDDLSKITTIKEAKVGQRVVLKGRIELIEGQRSRFRKKLLTHALVSDDTGAIRAVWFNQPWIAKMFKSGDEIYLVGEVKDEGSGAYLSSPIYERALARPATHVARIVPVYPSTERLSQKQIRYLMQHALPLVSAVLDPLPEDIRKQYGLVSLSAALTSVHFPVGEQILKNARDRLKFDELLALQLFSASIKESLRSIPAPSVQFREEETKRFVGSLPFELTQDQRKAAWEIIGDLSGRKEQKNEKTKEPKDNNGSSVSQFLSSSVYSVHPMNRMLEGDVGSGKTVVVAIAALNAVLGNNVAGYRGQVAVLAPTGILARQHFTTFTKLLTPQGIKVELRTGEDKKKKTVIEADVVIGTHALIQEGVKFRNLVLAVVDEQHRFGVSQRQALRSKRNDGMMPHLLSLTATPIPRSLALVFYGDLDISILKEMPKGRQKIETRIVVDAPPLTPPPQGGETKQFPPLAEGRSGGVWSRQYAYDFVRKEVKAGRQVFWTCPIIDPSDILGVNSATEVFEHLQKEIFPDLRIGLLHGRMRPKEREAVMEEFSSGALGILVATPVIEVGIDIPNATVMVIEGSERFGLAQLHQFRGRVGRGEAQSYCLLIVDDRDVVAATFRSPDGGLKASATNNRVGARLQSFLECSDGFEIAELDLRLRGPGEMYGTVQSGFPEFKIASFADVEIAKNAKEAAQILLKDDPDLLRYPELKKALIAREGKTHLE
ncbi:MAG: ATP-dependent DNA helicase RecG [bacterium]|nr:ATP-dependent DNA helicase RecG [bacterium]